MATPSAANEPTFPEEPDADGSKPTSVTQWPPEQVEHFLDELDANVTLAAKRAERDADAIRSRERLLFRITVFTAIVTFLLAAVGVVLIFLGILAAGALSAAIAVLPGSGTAILSRMKRATEAQYQSKLAAAEDDRRVYQALQTVRLVPEPRARSIAMMDFAQTMVQRISN